NMTLPMMAEAVAIRNQCTPKVILEASGGVQPDTVGDIARTGVDRISSGWPTHHAPWLDVGLDWKN
ncbi:MAG: nicotinate-nucleotide diphosphorylase (carboxylating), partial [Pirellulales bacterium]